MDWETLYQTALAVTKPRQLTNAAEAGEVGAAIVTKAGNVYTGVCIDACCGVGFCAEHAAAAAMITAGENQIDKIIAVGYRGNIMPPCGRCREFLSELAAENMEAMVRVNAKTAVRLKELLPYDWRSCPPEEAIHRGALED